MEKENETAQQLGLCVSDCLQWCFTVVGTVIDQSYGSLQVVCKTK